MCWRGSGQSEWTTKKGMGAIGEVWVGKEDGWKVWCEKEKERNWRLKRGGWQG